MRSATWVTIIASFMFGTTAFAETVMLAESGKENQIRSISIQTTLAGNLTILREDKKIPLSLSANIEHQFAERLLKIEGNQLATKAARFYSKALSTAKLDKSTMEKRLRPVRQLVVGQKVGDSHLVYSPTGPMTREELELVGEHFDTLAIGALLPGKAVAQGDQWKIEPKVAQAVCLFEGLIEHELTGKLVEVNAEMALIQIVGKAKGIENGAMVSLTIEGKLTFDRKANLIKQIEWKQKDKRDQGPASPEAEVESTTVVNRILLSEEPKELNNEVIGKIPAGEEVPGIVKQVLKEDAKGRYRLLHSREWHAVGQTDFHLVMRLLDRGDFVAQATITAWKNATPGKHLSPEDFEKLVMNPQVWTPERILDKQEIPGDNDKWIYRITAKGDLDGEKVVQNFFVIADKNGNQVIVTFTMKQGNLARLGTKDLAFVSSIEMLSK